MGEKVFSFETDDEIVKFSSEFGFNDIKFPLLAVMKVFTSCYIKNISLFENMKIHHRKMSMSICIKKGEELKGDNITVENEGIVE